ncbi:hypothetical protein UlMin_040923 [Ulmus minor]
MGTTYAPSSSSLFLQTRTPSLLRRRFLSIFISSKPFPSNPRYGSSRLRLFASIAERDVELSWLSPDKNANTDYGGWAVSESPVRTNKRGLPIFMIGGVGASMAALFAAIAYFSLSRKGFKFQLTSPWHGLPSLSGTKDQSVQITTTDSGTADGISLVLETNPESIASRVSEEVTSSSDKLERVIIPVAVDSTQQKALSVLKKLKIIEDDVKADELCTRREYARWLVRMNNILDRNARHRIVPSVSLSGSIIAAFDDISVEDPDFGAIQALAEAGILSSKLSLNSSYDGLKGQEGISFLPDRFLSRQDLIDWQAQLEYEFEPGVMEQISTTKVGFMDLKEIRSDASAQLYMDLLAGDKSILRKVFGQSKRIQPNKPSTKAQVAVTLTSGRMKEEVQNELLRRKAEDSARKAAVEEIRSELLDREDIKRFWNEKLNEEKSRGLEVEKAYLAAVSDLELEKLIQEKHYADHLKVKVAIDCQRQLLLHLKEEVNEMSEKLATERTMYVAEQCNLQDMLTDLESKQESMLDTKSILEAEKEALRILRSWVEDEGRKSHARAKVLEEVGRRWKWEDQA